MSAKVNTTANKLLEMHDALTKRTTSRLDELESSLVALKAAAQQSTQAAETSAPAAAAATANARVNQLDEARSQALQRIKRMTSTARRDHRVMQTAISACRRDLKAAVPPPLPQLAPTEDVLGKLRSDQPEQMQSHK